jgi:hypothetical protein
MPLLGNRGYQLMLDAAAWHARQYLGINFAKHHVQDKKPDKKPMSRPLC